MTVGVRTPRRRGGPCDRGSGTVLTAAGIIVLVVTTLAGWWVVAWTDAVHQSRNAADLAALAGASAYAVSRDPCEAARQIAAANRARLVDCRSAGGRQAFTVTVRVAVELHPRVRGGPREVAADAVAGSGMH